MDEMDSAPQVGDRYNFTKERRYVGLYSSTHFELFYVFFVTKKAVADEDKCDIYGHTVQKGEHYLEGNYLEKTRETSWKIFYKRINKTAYIHEEEIFMPAITIDESELSIEKSEYIYLADCI